MFMFAQEIIRVQVLGLKQSGNTKPREFNGMVQRPGSGPSPATAFDH